MFGPLIKNEWKHDPDAEESPTRYDGWHDAGVNHSQPSHSLHAQQMIHYAYTKVYLWNPAWICRIHEWFSRLRIDYRAKVMVDSELKIEYEKTTSLLHPLFQLIDLLPNMYIGHIWLLKRQSHQMLEYILGSIKLNQYFTKERLWFLNIFVW